MKVSGLSEDAIFALGSLFSVYYVRHYGPAFIIPRGRNGKEAFLNSFCIPLT